MSSDNEQSEQKPKTLQELIAGNALIDAFMGGGVPVPRQQHPEARVEAILATIDSCSDIESLVAGVAVDMESVGVVSNYDKTQVHLDTLAARLSRIKSLMYNERTTTTSFAQSFFSQPQFKTVASALLHSLLLDEERKMLLPTLLTNLHNLPFEARKDVASIFNYLLVCGCIYNIAGAPSDQACSDASAASYTKTMIAFVNYIDEYYEDILKPIVDGHYVGTTPSVGNIEEVKEEEQKLDSANTSSNDNQSRQSQPAKTVDVALHCGSMLRSTLRHPRLYANLVTEKNTPNMVYPFLDIFANQLNFEVASDALETLRLIMHPDGNAIAVPSVSLSSPSTTVSKPNELESMMEDAAASFLLRDYKSIFMKRFNAKLLSAQHANYITRRVSLQILSTILLTRTNYNVMIKYIADRSNLKTIMMLLRDPSAHITLEAFNVFKIFVANPNKPEDIVRILADNKVKLVKYLTGLHGEKEASDEQFKDEKALVIATLQHLE